MLEQLNKLTFGLKKAMGIEDLVSNFITNEDEQAVYSTRPSFMDFLPWREYSWSDSAFLFNDGESVGSAFYVTPVNVDGFSDEFIYQVRSALRDAIHTIPGRKVDPWVLSFYVRKERISDAEEWLRAYIHPRARGTELTESYVQHLVEHIEQISDPRGVFEDGGAVWRGCRQVVRMCIWRKANKADLKSEEKTAVQEHHEVVDRFVAALNDQGIQTKRMVGKDMYHWCFPWFNPAPEETGDPYEYMKLHPFPENEERNGELPLSFDLASMCFATEPEALDPRDGVIQLGGGVSEYLSLKPVTAAPRMGAMCLELKKEGVDNSAAIVDALPPGSTLAITVTILDQDVVAAKSDELIGSLKNLDDGASDAAELALRQAKDYRFMKQNGGVGHHLTWGIYLEGKSEKHLRKRRAKVSQLMLRMGFPIIHPRDDAVKQNSFIRQLPFAYRPEFAPSEKRSGLTYSHHIANILPVYGRSTGTGNPGFLFWNRTGELLSLDPFNKNDRRRAAHGVLLGPSGAGKSATTCYLTEHLMAFLRPQIFLIEPAGNSYGLLSEHFKSKGLKVEHKRLSPTSDVTISPFADAIKALSQFEKQDDPYKTELEESLNVSDEFLDAESDDMGGDDDDARDILGEMELSARLMITGGETLEEAKFERPDRLLIREAILRAAKIVRDETDRSEVVVSDLVDALEWYAEHDKVPRRQLRAQYMADTLKLFCDGIDAKFFNRPGKSWSSDADITIVDLDIYAKEDNEDKLAIVMTGLLNRINGIAEANQHSGRPIIVWIDEAHKATTNPLLAPYIATISKMWRKLGCWLWLATQNMTDFPDVSRKMLSMAEFWLLLVPPPNEIKEISRFKDLTEDEQSLLREARKAPPNYIEGVILSDKLKALFRNIPPSRSLAMGMTEKHEKAERAEIMDRLGITEVEAAYEVANRLKAKRDKFKEQQEA